LIANANDLKGSDGKYSFAELKSVLTDSGSLFGVDFKNEVVAACNAQPSVDLEGVSVDLTSACLALDGWDGKYLRTSRGAHVMREVLNQYRVNSHKDIADSLFEVPFNQLDPINTPRGLSDSSGILEALARTVTLLSSLDIVFNASLEELQFVVKNGEAIAVPGGYSHEGVFNMAEKRVLGALGTSELANLPVGTLIGDSLLTSRDDDNDGVDSAAYRVNYGTSIVFAAEMTPSGPVVDAFLTYGQSHEPSSENFTNLTQRYSDGEWLPMSFSESAIEADLVETIQLSGSIKN
jgi:acyl-homoserine-lactone acylase